MFDNYLKRFTLKDQMVLFLICIIYFKPFDKKMMFHDLAVISILI